MDKSGNSSHRVLVTGGSGFIGTHLRARLSARGVPCTVLDLVDPGPLAPTERFVRGDVRSPATVRTAIEDVQGVYHLAAAHHDFGIDESTFEGVNVHGMRVLCEEAARAGIERILFTSSVAVYGTRTPGAHETSVPAPVSPYGHTKLRAESVLREWAGERGSRSAMIVRPAVVYGPKSFANMFSLVRQIQRGRFALVGPGENVKSIVYVENLLDMIDFLTDRSEPGVVLFNAVDCPDLTSREIATILARAVGRSSIPSLPLALARLAAIPFDVITALSGRDLGFSSARLEKFALQETRFSGAALRTSGYVQRVSAEEGLCTMARWYLDEGITVTSPPRHLPPANVVT